MTRKPHRDESGAVKLNGLDPCHVEPGTIFPFAPGLIAEIQSIRFGLPDAPDELRIIARVREAKKAKP